MQWKYTDTANWFKRKHMYKNRDKKIDSDLSNLLRFFGLTIVPNINIWCENGFVLNV